MKEKILAILLATLMLLSLVACGEKTPAADTGKPEDTQQSEQTQSENTTTAASETEEKSDNENAWAGRDKTMLETVFADKLVK